jgi:hypothetical protein
MNLEHNCLATLGSSMPPRRHSLRSMAGAMALIVFSLLVGLPAIAFDGRTGDVVVSNSPGEPVPFALSDVPVAHDSSFNGGSYFGDAFAGPTSNYYLGRKLVRLGNGDVIVAALVPHTTGSNVAGRWNLGLVRYNSAGQRVAWANPGANGHFGNQYIVTPNLQIAAYTEVVDIVASETAQNRFYVMLNTIAQDGTAGVNIIAFDYQGAFQGAVSPFLNLPGSQTGAGLVYYRQGFGETYKLVVIGTRFDNGKGRPIYLRMNAFGFASETGVEDIHPTVGPCSTNTQTGGCIATAVTSVQWSAFEWLPPRIYVAGVITRNLAPDDTDFFVTRIKGGTGTGVGAWDPSFGTGGTQSALFDVGGNLRDYVTGVAARRGGPDPAQPLGNNTGDEIYVVGQVAQACTPGIGIAAFNHNGTPADFGAFGKQRFGGQALPCNQYLFESADYANAVIYDNDRLVIVGFSAYERVCLPPGSPCEDGVDPMIAIVRGRDGLIQEHRDFPVQPGQRIRHGGLYDVVIGGGGYTVTGDNRYFNSDPNVPGRQEVTTARFRLDRIFGNGLDCGGGFPDPNPAGCN